MKSTTNTILVYDRDSESKTRSGIRVLQLAQRIRRTNVRDLHTEYIDRHIGAAGCNAVGSGTVRVW